MHSMDLILSCSGTMHYSFYQKLLQRPPLVQIFPNLHRVQGRPLTNLITRDEQDNAAGVARVFADTPHQDLIALARL